MLEFVGLAAGLLVAALLLRLAVALWRREHKPQVRYPGGYFNRRAGRIEITGRPLPAPPANQEKN
jgi:hypothetical protein